LPGSARPITTADFEWFKRSVDPQAYWPLIACPTLFLEAANDFNAPFDLVVKGMSLQPTNVSQRLAVAPHFNHRFDANSYAARVLWQKAHLTDGFDFPQTATAELDLTQPDGIPVFSVWPDENTSNAVIGVDIYYGFDRDSRTRFWRDAQAVEVSNGCWQAECPVYDVNEPLVVFANVIYALDFDLDLPAGYGSPVQTFSVASEVSTVYPPELENNGVVATEVPLRLIDDFSRGYHDWYLLNEGSSALWQFWTRKLNDPSWTGLGGTELTLDVDTTVAGNVLGIQLVVGQWNA
ncbi:hypothetical protein P4B35_23830, partial [Pontiellaceae bacterium B12227]|nr:hypothetical protein [Pontiellaceae bacterium B12227]